MGKSFSDNEKAIIRNKLRNGSIDLLLRYGVRKTTVEDLVKLAGISKGAFYIFYPSKEVLMFEVMTDFQSSVHQEMIESVKMIDGEITPDAVTTILFNLMKKVDNSFMVTMFQNGDLEYLQRRLPEELLANHQNDDDTICGELCSLLPVKVPQERIDLFSAALRAIALTMNDRKAIGEKLYDEVLRLLIRGIVEQLFKK